MRFHIFLLGAVVVAALPFQLDDPSEDDTPDGDGYPPKGWTPGPILQSLINLTERELKVAEFIFVMDNATVATNTDQITTRFLELEHLLKSTVDLALGQESALKKANSSAKLTIYDSYGTINYLAQFDENFVYIAEAWRDKEPYLSKAQFLQLRKELLHYTAGFKSLFLHLSNVSPASTRKDIFPNGWAGAEFLVQTMTELPKPPPKRPKSLLEALPVLLQDHVKFGEIIAAYPKSGFKPFMTWLANTAPLLAYINDATRDCNIETGKWGTNDDPDYDRNAHRQNLTTSDKDQILKINLAIVLQIEANTKAIVEKKQPFSYDQLEYLRNYVVTDFHKLPSAMGDDKNPEDLSERLGTALLHNEDYFCTAFPINCSNREYTPRQVQDALPAAVSH